HLYGNGLVNLELEIQRAKDRNPLRNVIDTNKSREIYLCNQEHDSLEAQVVKFADFLSFSIHDLDDGLRAGKLSLNELEEMLFWGEEKCDDEVDYDLLKDEYKTLVKQREMAYNLTNDVEQQIVDEVENNDTTALYELLTILVQNEYNHKAMINYLQETN
ncbi:MAG: hypothetical protein DRJ64_07295, partial [Thermoprotei archaeon]